MMRVGKTLQCQRQRLFDRLRWCVMAHAKLVLTVTSIICLLTLLYAWRHIEFLTGRNQLVATSKPYLQRDEKYAATFQGLEELVVVAESPHLEAAKAFIHDLAEELQGDTTHIKDLFYHFDTSSLQGKKLLLLSPGSLQSLQSQIANHQDAVRDIALHPGLFTVLNEMDHAFDIAMVSHLTRNFLGQKGEQGAQLTNPRDLSFLSSLLKGMNAALDSVNFKYVSPWTQLFGNVRLFDDGFLLSDDRRLVFLLIEPRLQGEGFDARRESIAAIRHTIKGLLSKYPGVEAGVTGEKVLDNDEMAAAQTDASVSTVFSLIGVAFLYFLFFRSVQRTLFVVATILVSVSWSLGAIALTIGHLSLISIFVAPILVGLADDRIVYFLSRYEEERDRGKSAREAVAVTFTSTLPSIFTAGATNALGFFAMMGADFRGVQELGFITGTGLLLSCVATMSFLPALLLVTESSRAWNRSMRQDSWIAHGFMWWGNNIKRHRRFIMVFIISACAVGCAALPSIAFDANLLHLQSHDAESVVWEQRILSHAGHSSWFALATASSLTDVAQKADRFASLSTVERVESITSLMPPNQEARLQEIHALAASVAGFPPVLPAPTPVNLTKLKLTLEHLRFKLQSVAREGREETQKDLSEVGQARTVLASVLKQLQKLPPPQAGIRLDFFQEQLFQDLNETWTMLNDNLHPSGPITLADIPLQVKRRFVSEDGSLFLLQIYPRVDIWEWKPLQAFVTELRQIDATVTGSPVIGYESIRAITKGYGYAGIYAMAVIVIVAFVTMKRTKFVFLTLLPLIGGSLLTILLMRLIGLTLNLANLVAIPITLGIGVESGVYFVRRIREEHCEGWRFVAGSTGQAIALFSLSTMVGFGSLMTARHYGIFSMGLLLFLAVGCVSVISLTLLPLCFSSQNPESGGMQNRSGLPIVEEM